MDLQEGLYPRGVVLILSREAERYGPHCDRYDDDDYDAFDVYTDGVLCERGEVVDWVNSWILNTHARHHPLRIVTMDADGAPELSSKSFRAK